MKTILPTALALMTVIFIACNRNDSDYNTEQAELKVEREELRREYVEMKEEYLREKAEFQKQQKALRRSVKKEYPTDSVKRDTTARQLTTTEVSELTDKVKSAGLWPNNK